MSWTLDADAGPSRKGRTEPSPRPSVAEMSQLDDADVEEGVDTAKHESQWMTGTGLVVLMFLVTTVVFLMMLDASIISTAIPRITDEFHSLPDVGWYVTVFQLASAALQPLSGKVYHKFSNKISFLVFFGIFELGSTLCGAATSSAMLIAGRAVAGIGSAGLNNGALTIIASAVPLPKRPLLTGLMMALSQIGIVLGPLVGGAFTSYATWRWCFYVNLPIGFVVVVGLVLIRIPDQSAKPRPWTVLRRLYLELDLPGFALLAPAAVQLLLALSWGGTKYAWNSENIIGLFCGSGATALAWLAWNLYGGDNALIPFSIIRVRATWSGALTQCFLLTIAYCVSFFLPIYFQAVRGASPMMSGVYILPGIISQLLMTGIGGRLLQWTGYVIPYVMLSGICSSISSGLISTFTPTTSTSKWIGYQILNGAGRGLGMQMPLIAVQAALKPEDISIGMSIVVFVQSLGTAITLAVSDVIFQGSLESELSKQAPLADAAAIIAAGATSFRNIVNDRDLPGVLMAYSIAIDRVFYLVAGVSGLAVLTSLFLGWVNVRKEWETG
ncbi:major facilitator superfamily domain-containing protein [Achaetomium macrosporum]|uniref:Major facilitator superfamily domain-containing protein n=1 Tax=Achaetomium macrosporum TaxID=79813 RepID=A0AAN7C100_9PEZI|nr:major facilitator superfamily domain-containing protein [Achaetomium macrosporum]